MALQVTHLQASSSYTERSASLLDDVEPLTMSDRTRIRLVQKARLVTYVSLAVTLAGGMAGIMASLALDRCAADT